MNIPILPSGATSNPCHGLDWLDGWTSAYASFTNKDYTAAIAQFEALKQEHVVLRTNLNVILGQCHHYNGSHAKALSTLQAAHRSGMVTQTRFFTIKSVIKPSEIATGWRGFIDPRHH